MNKEDIRYYFEKFQFEINKKEVIYLDYKDFFVRFNQKATSFIDSPKTTILELNDTASTWREDKKPIKIIFNNIMTEKILISELKKEYLDRLIKLECYVKFKSKIYPKVSSILYECKRCNALNKKSDSCWQCKNKEFFEREEFNDQFVALVEEDPAVLGAEHRPQSTYAYFNEELKERYNEITSGARITLFATPYIRKRKKGQDYCLDIHNFEVVKDGIERIEVTKKEIEGLKQEEDILKKSCQSIFKDIYGLDKIKEAIVLQMISSSKEQKGDFVRNRGNLMILLVGSPGVSKSVCLKKVSHFFPRSRYASCSMATGIGLVASTRKDEVTGTYMVEAGAIPLCHKSGIISCDELDKINKQDLGHMNTMMDSLKIVIDKANVHTVLPADVSILAAMNPKDKVFDTQEDFYKQLNLPKDFLDRFDLIFCIDSLTDKETSNKITDVVLSRLDEIPQIIKEEKILKYIAYARTFNPTLSTEAKEYIKERYNQLMDSSNLEKGSRFSTRLLTNFIRISGAYARARFSNEIEKTDCRKAFNLMIYSLESLGIVRKESGKITYDVIKAEEIVPKSKRDKVKIIRKFLDGKEPTNIEQLKEKVAFEDFDEIIDLMKRNGEIIEPRRNMLKLI